jgi:pyruvate ferredoxin oxidoreductase gamma subunit
MSGCIEVRWHGRAQQGVVTAAKVLGETALCTGKHVQAFPEFGPERMGAPVKAYNRISDDEIRIHSQVTNPGFVLIADPTLLAVVDVTEGAPDDAVYIINTSKSPSEMRTALGKRADKARVFTVDASHISNECIGRNMPNTPLLAAFARATGIIKLDDLLDGFQENYSKKYSQNVIAGNLSAMKRGFDEVRGE